MRRILLVLLAILVGTSTLLAFYVAWDPDPDQQSPLVDVPGYRQMFEDAVRRRSGSPWSDLDPARRQKVVADLIASKEAAPVREVALWITRELADPDAALATLKRALPTLSPDHYEVAVGSLSAIRSPKARIYLDSLYKALDADPAAHTPVGGYRSGSLLVSHAGSDIAMQFNERSRLDASYEGAKVPEITLFFPAAPDYFVAVPNADDQLRAFEDSRFVHALDNTPVPDDAWSLPLLRVIRSLRSRLDESMGAVAPYFSPEKLFRDNLLLGRYGNDYLMASFKDKNLTVAEAMITTFEALGRDFGIKRWQAGGTTVAGIFSKLSGKMLCYATPGDYFVLATDSALISRALETHTTEQTLSLGFDPLFRTSYAEVDQSGERDPLFAWVNPTTYFDPTGARDHAAQRRVVVARALGKQISVPAATAIAPEAMMAMPGTVAAVTAAGEDPVALWRYVVAVRSLGRNQIDSLARVAKIDMAKQVMPYLSPSMTLGYGGVEYLREQYGYSNTEFDLTSVFPLRNPPARFDSTIKTLFQRTTSLVYAPSTLPSATGEPVRLWIARDTTTSDTFLLERKLQPSFALVGTRLLVVASTPASLRAIVQNLAGTPNLTPAGTATVLSGRLSVDSLAANTGRYMRSFLLRSGRYSPAEVQTRLNPLETAVRLYSYFDWKMEEKNGLRVGAGRLVAAK